MFLHFMEELVALDPVDSVPDIENKLLISTHVHTYSTSFLHSIMAFVTLQQPSPRLNGVTVIGFCYLVEKC